MNKTKILLALMLTFIFQLTHAGNGMPGMRGTQHLGFTVPNVKEATAVFADILGCESFYSIGPFGPFDNNWMTENLNVNKKAVINTAILMRFGNGPALEVFEYTSPGQRKQLPRNSDIGGHHLAFM